MASLNYPQRTFLYVRAPPIGSDAQQQSSFCDKLWIYFQNKRVSRDSDVLDVRILASDDEALWLKVTFNEPSGVNAVLATEHHELSFEKETISLHVQSFFLGPGFTAPPVDSDSDIEILNLDDQGEEEEAVQLVEATGFKSTTSEEMLRLYFENPRKSEGGEVETWEMDTKTKTIRIEYRDPSVARAVTKKTHQLDGVILTVRHILKGKTLPRPVKKRCLFLRGIPDGCSPDHVQLYLWTCSGMEEPIIKYGEKPGTALCTFTQDIPDLQKVIQKICSKKLKRAQVTAEVVHEPDCILVQGLPNNMSLKVIELYFDIKKKSGGGGVRKVLPGNAEDQAIVYFTDWKVVADVLTKKGPHKVGSTEVSVEEYHDCLGKLNELDFPTQHFPEELRTKAHRDAQRTKKEIAMTTNRLELFTQCSIRRKMEKMFPDLKITVASFQGQTGLSLILEGTRKEVIEAELWMRRKMDGLNSVEFKTGRGKTAFIRDVSDKIHEILGSKDINAACNISADGKIKIYGCTKGDTSMAKLYIDQEIDEDIIRINGPAVSDVLKSQEGILLVADINKKKFAKATINYESGNIELVGFRNELKETKRHMLAFLKDTVRVNDTICTNRSKVRLITSFHGQELTGFTAKHQRDHVIIQPQMSGRNAGFLVEGNEEGLDAATLFVSQLVARIKEKLYPVSKIGMVQLFRETKGKKFLEFVEEELECVIDVIGENENNDEDVEGAEGATVSPPQTGATEVLCRISLFNGCTLRVCKGDLTKQKVDCIVNAANVDLKHGGGLAAAILQAGGQIIQTECDEILKKKPGRQLQIGEPVCTSGGSLHCKKVIHVAGPRWLSWKRKKLDDQPTHEDHLLFNSVFRCLQLANQLKMQSIAIPAISTGLFGFPTERAAVQIVNAVVEFNQKVSDTSLTEIGLTNHDQQTCDVIKQVAIDQLGHPIAAKACIDDTAVAPGNTMPMTFTSSGPNIMTTNEGINVTLKKGSVTEEKADVIVNTSSSDLNLKMGLVSQAILKAAGRALQQECDTAIAARGKVPPGSFVETGAAGMTNCKKIFHCVIDRYHPNASEKPLGVLVENLLQQAEIIRALSLAIPALGTGNLGYPADVTARVMYEAVAAFSGKHPTGVLKDIRFVVYDKDMKTIKGFEDEIERLTTMTYGGAAPASTQRKLRQSTSTAAGATGVWMPDDKPAVVPITFTSSGPNILTTNEGINVTLKKGSVTEEQADVIVNASNIDLNLSIGLVSKAILQVAGAALQQECDTAIAARGKVPSGSFVETGAAAMTNCKKIFHCVIDRYHPNASEKTLSALVESLVEQAEIIQMHSLAIPALGTGNMGYPADVTARVMYEAVAAFSSKHPTGVLKDIRFVVYDKDMKTIKGFEDEIERLTTSEGPPPAFTQRNLRQSTSATAGEPKGATQNEETPDPILLKRMFLLVDRHPFSQVQKDSAGTLQAKIGSVCLQICQGDLVTEKSTAIVNSVGEKLDLQGPLSRALLDKGGKKVKKECDAFRKKDPTKSVYVTTAGKLYCDFIFHGVTPKTPEETKIIVTKVLLGAERKQVKSISFPALGTGTLVGQAVGPSASAMLAAIGEFICKEKPRHLLLIRLVIFKPEMLPDFEAALRQKEDRPYKKQASIPSRGLGLAKSVRPVATVEDTSNDESQRETILLHICAMDDVTIQRATDKIDRYQDEEFTSEDMPDSLGMIAKMRKEHHAELRTIERKYNVGIEVSKGRAKFHVQGLTMNVKDARFSIQEMFTKMQFQENKKQRRKHLTKEVQWKYSTPTGVGVYDAKSNAIIEHAYQRKQPSVAMDLKKGRVTIDFNKMQEQSEDGSVSITRVDFQEVAKFETPSCWKPMKKGEHFKLVKLIAASEEYTDVERRFRSSMGINPTVNQIVEILRIQNTELMMQYQARKAALQARLDRTDIEETLYHGTEEQTCDQINRFGFNRSFSGKNATLYGNGTYFAAAASYSARPNYAKPNASNTKHIYATKVLVGDFTKGAQDMKVPPNKPNNPDQLYDSVVDNVDKPSIYIIFHDAQAYPEHLIKFN